MSRPSGGPVLVTGAAGLIGSQLVPALRADGQPVVTTSGTAGRDVDEPGVDLSCPAAVAALIERVRPRQVVHLAGGAATDRHELFRRNVLATVHLLEALAAFDPAVDCLVFGSAAEYGDGDGRPVAEDAPLRPVSDYGRAKAAQTTLAAWLATTRRLRVTIVRPFNLASARLPVSVALGHLRRQLLAATVRRPAVRCGRLDVVRDYVPLDLVIEAVRRLVRQPASGEVINLCSGVGLAVGEILAAMARRLGVEPVVTISDDLAAIPAGRSVIGDPTKMRRILGLAPEPTADSIAEAVLGR